MREGFVENIFYKKSLSYIVVIKIGSYNIHRGYGYCMSRKAQSLVIVAI